MYNSKTYREYEKIRQRKRVGCKMLLINSLNKKAIKTT